MSSCNINLNISDEFLPASGSEDDEETIAKAEEDAKDVKAEVTALKRESQMEIDDFLKDLPKGYLENRSKLIAEEQTEKSAMKSADEEDDDDDDDEFEASGTSEDDEDTIVEQEKKERNIDYKKEIDELEADNDLSVEQLLQKYKPNNKLDKSEQMEVDSDDDVEVDADEKEASSDTENEAVNDETDSDDVEESDEEIETDAESEEMEDGLKTLFDEHNESSGVGSKDDMIKDAAALAESIQPKGNTLSSTNVVTPVPFLLKHSLREYQHIGLDWLVTMYERKLNGILADEMGLGKTIQTIALLAHLACEKANWGPHLIVVPSSVMLNWEMEFKKWCPGFKILTYYGTQKERKAKRVGWTKPNAFHVCITSYKLVVQDQQSFRRKKWKYLILDEAQNIKNFKSQRWQLLLNFSTERRLLLTGTPLQNDLMELWSLMHFLMPHVFSSHREFKEWFSNPMTGMIEGNLEYNETLISRLHKVIRPFLLRRLKKEVEKQMPSKYEHVIMCRLSNRQRYLYDDFMSRAKTKETLQSGNLLSVINVLMQLRKVCNHPNMFEVRPIISPFQMEGITLQLPGLVYDIFQHDPFTDIDLHVVNLNLLKLELMMTAYVAYKMRQLAPTRKLIEEVDTSVQHLAPACPKSKYRFHIRIRDQSVQKILSKHSTFQVQVGASPTMKKTEGNQLVPACSSLLPFSCRIKRLVNLNKINPVHSSSELIMSNSPTTTTTTTTTQSAQQQQPPPLAALGSSSVVVKEENLQDSAENKIFNQSTSISTMGSNEAVQSDVLVNQIAQHVRTSIKPTTGSTQKENINIDKTINVDDLDVYNMQEIYSQRKEQRLDRLKLMATINERRTTAAPIYGADCRTAMEKLQEPTSTLKYSNWQIRSSYNCGLAMSQREETWVLNKILRSYAQRCEYLEHACSNFILFVPKASAKLPQLYVSKLSSTQLQTQRHIDETVKREMSPKLSLLHPIISAMTTQFPDPRLIQYDCGKLQTLDKLLRQLKSEQHRVLIFTQMTKMLDVLEAFLNYHGHIYLRLDGSTRVEQRQLLMERFNGDKRIFCFILSTRSGGVGINLTGADTVIFYDSDWNPTMDAQAQDRCHRIGQTRDVHIYRLVSEKTIEVNILQKANQKRMLSDMAIEGGNFTTTFFKSSTIKDLFNVEQLEQQQIESSSNSQDTATSASTNENEKLSLKVFENALAEAEDEQDVQATKTARAEAAADLAEFDETIPIEDSNNETTTAATAAGQEMSKVDLEMQNLVKQLSPIERYAMRFVEETGAAWSEAQLKAAEAEIEAQKREWEANRLAARQKEEEMLQREAEEASPEDMMTYSRRDANNQVVNKSKQKEQATNLRKNTNISKRFAKRNRDSKLNVQKVNCRGGAVREARKQAQTTMKNRVLNSRRKLAVRQMRRNRRNNQLHKNDQEQQESSENDDNDNVDDNDEEQAEEEVTELVEKYSTRSTTSLEKEIPVVSVKSKTGVKNQKLLNIARLKQNESKITKLPTRRLAVVLTNTKRVLRNNTIRQSLNKSRIDTRTKNNINTQTMNFRNKLRSESCRSSENTEEDEAKKFESEQPAEDTSESDDCNGRISNSQENTNSSTTYYNVSEEESEDDDESSEVEQVEEEVEVEVEEEQSDKTNAKVLTKQILKTTLNCNIESETTPRTRSRGTVNIDLWTLDNSLLATNCHANVSRSSKKDTNEQNNVSKVNDTQVHISIDKKSRVYLKRRKTDDFESKPSKLNTLDHWITPTKNGSPNTFHDNDS